MQVPADCCDVSFLLETNHLEEKENIGARETFVRQQKEQLENDRQNLLDFAAELAKKVLSILSLFSTVQHWNKLCSFIDTNEVCSFVWQSRVHIFLLFFVHV